MNIFKFLNTKNIEIQRFFDENDITGILINHPEQEIDVYQIIQLQNNGRNFPPNYLHDSWRDYLYWDTELEN